MRLVVIALLIAGCGSDAADGAADATPPPTCPEDPPAAGASCARAGETCQYERCATDGLITARCETGGWTTSSEACADLDCQGNSCVAGAICVANVGGAYLVSCQQHRCGDGPLACACVCGDETACTVGDIAAGDALFTCNTCNAEICP